MADDPRDDELAAQLHVEPLDDVTRRRLVHRALAESAPDDAAAPSSRGDRSLLTRLVAAAAVFFVLAVGVVALLTTSDNREGSLEAGRDLDRSSSALPQAGSGSVADQGASVAAEGAASADANASDASSKTAPATILGDVGDLSTAAARRRLLAMIDAAPLATATAAASGPTLDGCEVGGTPSAVVYATGTVDGRNAFVVVNERADGSRRVRLVISDPCEVRQLR